MGAKHSHCEQTLCFVALGQHQEKKTDFLPKKTKRNKMKFHLESTVFLNYAQATSFSIFQPHASSSWVDGFLKGKLQ